VLALQNKAVIYDILFKAAAQTIRDIAADPKYLGAKYLELSKILQADNVFAQGPNVERGSVHFSGVIPAESAVEKRADPGVELGVVTAAGGLGWRCLTSR
jgi:hypothetical protein